MQKNLILSITILIIWLNMVQLKAYHFYLYLYIDNIYFKKGVFLKMCIFTNLKARLKRLHNYLKSLKKFKFILIMTLFTYLPQILFLQLIVALLSIMFPDFQGVPHPSSTIDSSGIYLFLSLFIAPATETLFSQTIPIHLLLNKKRPSKKNIFITILISSIIFTWRHGYSISYLVFAFFMGAILAYSYIIYLLKARQGLENDFSPYLVVFSIHFLRNLTALGLRFILLNTLKL